MYNFTLHYSTKCVRVQIQPDGKARSTIQGRRETRVHWAMGQPKFGTKKRKTQMDCQTHCLDLDLNGKRPGVTSDGNISSYLIGRS